eukprot:3263395-Pleurochrysis_carterae.AAC.3
MAGASFLSVMLAAAVVEASARASMRACAQGCVLGTYAHEKFDPLRASACNDCTDVAEHQEFHCVGTHVIFARSLAYVQPVRSACPVFGRLIPLSPIDARSTEATVRAYQGRRSEALSGSGRHAAAHRDKGRSRLSNAGKTEFRLDAFLCARVANRSAA